MAKPNWTPIQIRLGDLIPWGDNPKYSTKEDARRLLETEKEFGQFQTFSVSPFLDDGKVNCYDGHQRDSAWRTAYGDDFEVWALQSDRHLTEAERRRFVLRAHNAHGQWSPDILSSWSSEDMDGGWFNSQTLKTWKADVTWLTERIKSEAPPVTDAEVDTDRAAELLEKWGVKLGDLWQIGEHRLICGDCTDAATVARVMEGEKAGAVVTDVPYGVTGCNWDAVIPFDCLWEMFESNTAPAAPFVTTSTQPFTSALVSSKYEWFKHAWVWNKKLSGNFLHAQRQPMKIHEDVCVFSRGECTYNPQMIKGINRLKGGSGKSKIWDVQLTGDVNDSYYPVSIIEIGNTDRANIEHPTEKPVPLFVYLVATYSNAGEVVLDPTAGSGTTLVSCENTGRRGRGIEISPAYVAVALERMSLAFPALPIHRLTAGE